MPERSAPRAMSRRARIDELPPAPWSPFPLVELCVLLGIVLMAIGFIGGGDRSMAFVLSGIGLASLAGLEQAIREHFAGFRSHTTLLAGACAAIVLVLLALVVKTAAVALAAGVAVFAGMWMVFRRAFQHRTGGLSFRA
jgi:lysylphosphatidylglycerol synthetase-like protein (DUF2156 family)